MAEKAIESGLPIPENILSQSAIDKENVWQKGIKNIATGVGISLFGLFTTEFLIAVGLIIICWGAGRNNQVAPFTRQS